MNDNQFGFKAGELEEIIRVITQFVDVNKAVIFGSRAKGNYQKGSDVDVAIWTTDNTELWQLPAALNEETLLPYKFDVLNFNNINNNELKEHINRVGIKIYQSRNYAAL